MPGDERDQPARAAAHDEQHRERRGRRAEVALREVEDPVGAVDERDAERDERGEPAEQRALHDDAGGRAPQELHDEQEQHASDDDRERAEHARRRHSPRIQAA